MRMKLANMIIFGPPLPILWLWCSKAGNRCLESHHIIDADLRHEVGLSPNIIDNFIYFRKLCKNTRGDVPTWSPITACPLRHLCGEGAKCPRTRDRTRRTWHDRCAQSMSRGWVHNHGILSRSISIVGISIERRLRVLTSPRCLISYATWTVIKKSINLI